MVNRRLLPVLIVAAALVATSFGAPANSTTSTNSTSTATAGTSSTTSNTTSTATKTDATKNVTASGTNSTTTSTAAKNSTSTEPKKVINSTGPDPGPYLSVGFRYQKVDKMAARVFGAVNATISDLSFLYTTEDKKKQLGVLTKPGDRLVFEVPQRFRGMRTVSRVWLMHRKPKEGTGTMKHVVKVPGTPPYEWDAQPTYHSLSCRDATTKKWHVWSGPRFYTHIAEPREFNDPKMDNRRFAEPREKGDPLYDHVDDWNRWVGAIPCDMFLVENVSPNSSTSAYGAVHGLRVEYRPNKTLDESLDQLKVFTKNTIFANPPARPNTHFGGGREISPETLHYQKEIYPGAKILNPKSKAIDRITDWLAIKEGGLVIRLRSGKPFAQCLVVLGNTKFDSFKNITSQTTRDGWVGLPGKTKAYVSLRSGNNTHVVIQRWQLDAAQILRIDAETDYTVPPSVQPTWVYGGAFIRLDVVGDPAHLMAVKCQYYANPFPKAPEADGARVVSNSSTANATLPAITKNATSSTTASATTNTSTTANQTASTGSNTTTTTNATATTAVKNATTSLKHISLGAEIKHDLTHVVHTVERKIFHMKVRKQRKRKAAALAASSFLEEGADGVLDPRR